MTFPTLSIEWFWPFALSHLPEDSAGEIRLTDTQASGFKVQEVVGGLEESQVNVNSRQSLRRLAYSRASPGRLAGTLARGKGHGPSAVQKKCINAIEQVSLT